MDNTSNLFTSRSYLFVPANRIDRISKALSSDADAIIIDLEDAVSNAEKTIARKNLQAFFAQQTTKINKPVWIRINNIGGKQNDDTSDFKQDLLLCQQLKQHLLGIVLPKVENGETIEYVHNTTKLPIIAQLETAHAIYMLKAIVSKAYIKGLHAISYGTLDICNELNLSLNSQAQKDFINHLRYQLLLASKASGLSPPIESIYADFKDEKGLTKMANYVSDLGFSGMLAIHPNQLDSINEAFITSKIDISFAKKVINHYTKTKEATFAINGIMVDLPLINQCDAVIKKLNKN
ncbi:MAG: CoA ester lyase [Gammaproteobacteria bacterium]|nr:MAG: CoA ester lyase [Gammaproteobacteria bacterium]